MTESFILSDNEYYRQHDGVSVDPPLVPTFANIFLCVRKIHWVEKCPPKFKFIRDILMTLFCFFKLSIKL